MNKSCKNINSHIILYAKNHYKRTDIIEDLRILVGHRNYCDPKFITKSDVFHVILDITLPHILYHGEQKPENVLREFFIDLYPVNRFKFGSNEDEDYFLALIRKCLSYLRNTKICRSDGSMIMELDDPDYTILPKRPEKQHF